MILSIGLSLRMIITEDSGDPLFSSVTSLQQFNGNVTDIKGVSWTGYGDATTFGGDLVLDGNGDFIIAGSNLSIPAATAGCFEFFLSLPTGANGNYQGIYSSNSGSGTRWVLAIEPTGNLAVFTTAAGAWQNTGFASSTARKHYALCTDGANNIRLAVDGVWGTNLIGSFESTATNAIIGRMDTSVDSYYCAMTMGASRVTSGNSRYTLGTNFTPPTNPFPST